MKRVIVSLQNAPRELLNEIEKQYPKGVSEDELTPFNLLGGNSFRALEVELEDTVYLIKLNNFKFFQDYIEKVLEEDDDDDEDEDDDDFEDEDFDDFDGEEPDDSDD